MGIYDSQISQLQRQINALQQKINDRREELREAGTNMNAAGFLDPKLSGWISQIDEVQEAIEELRNWDEGSPNGFDELSQEFDFSDPDEWHKISHAFMPTSNEN